MLRDCGIVIMFLIGVFAFTAEKWHQEHEKVKELEKKVEKLEHAN